jgi:hypothetical protein
MARFVVGLVEQRGDEGLVIEGVASQGPEQEIDGALEVGVVCKIGVDGGQRGGLLVDGEQERVGDLAAGVWPARALVESPRGGRVSAVDAEQVGDAGEGHAGVGDAGGAWRLPGGGHALIEDGRGGGPATGADGGDAALLVGAGVSICGLDGFVEAAERQQRLGVPVGVAARLGAFDRGFEAAVFEEGR